MKALKKGTENPRVGSSILSLGTTTQEAFSVFVESLFCLTDCAFLNGLILPFAHFPSFDMPINYFMKRTCDIFEI